MMLADADGSSSGSGGTPHTSTHGLKSQTRLPATATNGSRQTAPESANGSTNGKTPVRSSHATPYYGHDREEITRILIQALSEMGYHSAADSVARESGYELENATVTDFRTAIEGGAWGHAERLLSEATIQGHGPPGEGLILKAGCDRSVMKFSIRKQKFLELLEQSDTTGALQVLRTELTPLYQDREQLQALSSLMMCHSPEDLRAKADWDGAGGQSRHTLLKDLSTCISPAVMLPEHRLAVLLEQVKRDQINNCIYHTSPHWPSLYTDHTCDRSRFPSEAVLELDKQSGEVWQILFSHDGSRLASSGSERHVTIWDTLSWTVVYRLDAHEGGVGHISWSPDDMMLVTCGSRDRFAKIWKVATGTCHKTLDRLGEPVSSCVWTADSRTLVTGSFDRERALCQWSVDGEMLHNWNSKHRTSDLAVSQDGHWLVAINEGQKLHVYNFITRELEYDMTLSARPTSISISQDSRSLLINQQDNQAQLFDIVTRHQIQSYVGQTGGEFLIRSSLGGADESFVVSGSEDGYLLVWHKTTGALIERLNAHQPRCNAVYWNPADPCMFASCGDDGKIKIWSTREHLQDLTYRRGQHHDGHTQNGW